MKYTEAVTEARTLVKRSEADQWRLAELTWEQLKAGKTQKEWARDIGVHDRTVGRWLSVWDRFGGIGAGARPSYSEAFQAVDKGLDPENIYAQRHQMEAQRTVRNMPPEQKADVVRQALADPAVTDRVLNDPAARRQISEGRERRYQSAEREVADRVEADPQLGMARAAALSVEIEKDIAMARWRLAEATRKLTELRDRDEDVMANLARAADEVADALEWLRVVIRGGVVDDAALAALLEGGGS